MKLSRTLVYAIEAALILARRPSGVPVPSGELAREGRMPERFLLHVLRCLVRRGILCSTRGVVGGYFLAREARHITLLDIVEAFDNLLDVSLPVPKHAMSRSDVYLLAAVQNAARAARDELQKMTLADLLRTEGAGVALQKAWKTPISSVLPKDVSGYSAADFEPVGEAPMGTLGGNGRSAI